MDKNIKYLLGGIIVIGAVYLLYKNKKEKTIKVTCNDGTIVDQAVCNNCRQMDPCLNHGGKKAFSNTFEQVKVSVSNVS